MRQCHMAAAAGPQATGQDMHGATLTPTERRAAMLMTDGGDARIVIDPALGTNRYYSTPWPRGEVLAYASSTANDISAPAFAHVTGLLRDGDEAMAPADYARRLDALRDRIRALYRLPDDVAVVFAPSGTDLEYVALAAALDRAPNGVHNILLGADEVGSGCVHSAHGRFFAAETALGEPVTAGQPVPELGDRVTLIDVPVRDAAGHARDSGSIMAAMTEAAESARADGRHALIHVVHGSKTGLILPLMDDIDRMLATHGDALSVVVDACQARITPDAVADYLRRDAIIFITGSKFMGGPPFSGFALVPGRVADRAAALPAGLAKVFARAEWPDRWPGQAALPERANPGLWLRLEASIFEAERFMRLPAGRVTRVILAFHAAVRRAMVETLGGRRVAPYPPGERAEGDAHPVEMRTLSTIDLSRLSGGSDVDAAIRLHRALVDDGIRLGQPVKCVAMPDGRWGATLRLGLSMPQIVALDPLDDSALAARLDADMDRIVAAIRRWTTDGI
jgi:hypothetical protein